MLLQQIRNPFTAPTAARSSAISRASSLTSSICTPRIQSTRAKPAERASRPNRISQRTRRFTQVRNDLDRVNPVPLNFHPHDIICRPFSGERPFECAVCHKRFRQKAHLQKHETTHSSATPFKCSVCDKAFGHVSNLNTHMATHSDVR